MSSIAVHVRVRKEKEIECVVGECSSALVYTICTPCHHVCFSMVYQSSAACALSPGTHIWHYPKISTQRGCRWLQLPRHLKLLSSPLKPVKAKSQAPFGTLYCSASGICICDYISTLALPKRTTNALIVRANKAGTKTISPFIVYLWWFSSGLISCHFAREMISRINGCRE